MIDHQALVEETLALCAIPAPTGEEGARAAAVLERLARIPGLTAWRDEIGNVLARLEGGRNPNGDPAEVRMSPVIVTAHLDTVFDVATPLAPRRDGETLRGPGIGDNTVAVAALLALAAELADRPRGRPLLLAATVGEEGLGNLRGVRTVLRAQPASCLIALEGHGLDEITVQAIGSVRLSVRCTAPGGHSWGDRGTPSAVHALAGVVAQLAAIVPAAIGGCSTNVGIFHGGTGINVIAAEALCAVDLRATDQVQLDAAELLARQIVAAATRPRVQFAIEEIGRRPAGILAHDHPLVLAAQAARARAGLPAAELAEGSTDANAAFEAGIPGISIGLTRGGGVHRTDEYIELAPLAHGVEAVLELIGELTH